MQKANDMFYVPSFRFSISLLFLMERYLASFGFDIILSVIFTSVCIAVSASCLGAVLKDRKAVSMLIDPLGVTIPDVELLLDRPMLPAPLPSFEVGLLRDKSTVLPSVMFSDANDSFLLQHFAQKYQSLQFLRAFHLELHSVHQIAYITIDWYFD